MQFTVRRGQVRRDTHGADVRKGHAAATFLRKLGLIVGLLLLPHSASMAADFLKELEGAAQGAVPVATATPAANGGSSAAGVEAKPVRIREGSKLVDQIGEFQKSGEQYNFFAKDMHGALRVLENLALERVVRELDNNPSMRVWSVSGIVTEFRGENYLLMTRTVLKAPSNPANAPAPQSNRSSTPE